jgi:hypothetical protein
MRKQGMAVMMRLSAVAARRNAMRQCPRAMSSIPRPGWDKSLEELDPEVFGLIRVGCGFSISNGLVILTAGFLLACAGGAAKTMEGHCSDPFRELCLIGCQHSIRLRHDQQVFRGVSGSEVLWRKRNYRQGRESLSIASTIYLPIGSKAVGSERSNSVRLPRELRSIHSLVAAA